MSTCKNGGHALVFLEAADVKHQFILNWNISITGRTTNKTNVVKLPITKVLKVMREDDELLLTSRMSWKDV